MNCWTWPASKPVPCPWHRSRQRSAALVDEARSTFLTNARGRNIVLDLEPDLPWVMADKRRIVQVLGNLLSNAVRYSPETSVIRLSGVLEDGFVGLSGG